MKFYIALFFHGIFYISTEGKHKLPSFIKVCRRSDPHLRKCVKESIDGLRPLLALGIPELGIPASEPLIIPEVIIDQGQGPVSMRSTYRNIQVYGPSQFTVKSVKIDMDKNKIKIKIWIPRLRIDTNYKMEGRILMMPISGEGISRGNYTNIEAILSMQGHKLQKNNETFFDIKNFFVDFNIGHATLQFDNLFNGDKELGDSMNLFLNDNWQNVANEIKPVLEDTIAGLFKKLSNRIFHKYPLHSLLPE